MILPNFQFWGAHFYKTKIKQTCVQMCCISSGVSTKSTSDLDMGDPQFYRSISSYVAMLEETHKLHKRAVNFSYFKSSKDLTRDNLGAWSRVKMSDNPRNTRFFSRRVVESNPLCSFFLQYSPTFMAKNFMVNCRHIFQSHSAHQGRHKQKTPPKSSMHGHTKIHKISGKLSP